MTATHVARDVEPAGAVLDDIAGDFVLDPAHTRLGFSARHAMVTKVHGRFTDIAGTAHVDTSDPGRSHVQVTIGAASVTTSQAQRDEHLRSADFFDVAEHPEITFCSTAVGRDGEEWTITGDLTIKNVTRSVTVPFVFTGSARDAYGNTRIGFEGAVALSRKDWGLTWNAALEAGGVLVSDRVVLELDIAAVRTTAG